MAFAMLFIAQKQVCAKKVQLEVAIALAQYFVTVIQNQRAQPLLLKLSSTRLQSHYHEPLPMERMNLFPTREQHLVLKFRLMPQVALHTHNLLSPQPIMDTINTSFSILYRSKVHGLNTCSFST
jgi:hypothetical protein